MKLDTLINSTDPIILDGGIGTELERLGAPMDHEAWCAVALESHPQLVRDVHRSYIDAGADIITVNTYAATRHALTNGGIEENFTSWNKLAVQLARETLDASEVDRNILIAGSVSNFGHFNDQYTDKQLAPNFRDQAEILIENGVDFIILESLGAKTSTIVTALNAISEFGVPIWVAVSCAEDHDSGQLFLGIEESRIDSHRPLAHQELGEAIDTIMDTAGSALLVMHSTVDTTLPALQLMQSHYDGLRGAYPNAGYWLRPEWAFVDQISPQNYLERARKWLDTGARIVGGCCGIGPDHIAALSKGLRNS
ncbi:Homocysteine S-methyltransferase [hydrothermal vent metagenome]|jgi:homocysteine S-methyltransferase|uniref:Homocysteine S-methyltransferase n=1 Tax=hydrothermal vent metagenome TaxID=652676 RepID=A0A160TS71_9ZZZZ|tara:strand:- start:60 stop:989 length:930 start_codon:yes stop_codon:yes gene_type:complete